MNECAEGLFKFSAREQPNKRFLFMVDKNPIDAINKEKYRLDGLLSKLYVLM
jgi:hypothetical protein